MRSWRGSRYSNRCLPPRSSSAQSSSASAWHLDRYFSAQSSQGSGKYDVLKRDFPLVERDTLRLRPIFLCLPDLFISVHSLLDHMCLKPFAKSPARKPNLPTEFECQRGLGHCSLLRTSVRDPHDWNHTLVTPTIGVNFVALEPIRTNVLSSTPSTITESPPMSLSQYIRDNTSDGRNIALVLIDVGMEGTPRRHQGSHRLTQPGCSLSTATTTLPTSSPTTLLTP